MQSFAQTTPQKSPAVSMAINKYQREQYLNLSPTEVILKLYDAVLLGSKKGDKLLAIRALTELIVSLNFEHQEMSTNLYRLYDYCKRQIYAGQFKHAITVISELREAWAQAFKLR